MTDISAPPSDTGASTTPASGASARVGFKDVLRVCSGNFLEMYDFMVFGYYAPSIGKAFFPSHDHVASLMLALMTFGAGFLMRPLGAIVLGAYADRYGRRSGLLLTLGIMAIGTASLALTPGYDRIGVAAPLIVLAGRLLQGFSAACRSIWPRSRRRPAAASMSAGSRPASSWR
jgi:MFS family permease